MDWSAQSAKNNPKESARVWKSFKPTRIGAGTIFYLAERAGLKRGPGTILLEAGKLHEAVDQSIQAIAEHANDLKLYRRADVLVRPTLVKRFGFLEADGNEPGCRRDVPAFTENANGLPYFRGIERF